LAYPLLRNRMGSVIALSYLLVGCYTDPINMRPSVSIDPQTEPLSRGEALHFTATWNDPNGDGASLWWLRTDTCPVAFADESNWPPAMQWMNEPFMNIDGQDTAATFCVWVKAVDSHGAASVDARQYDRVDHAPNALITLDAPTDDKSFPLHTQFQLSGASSTDEDASDMSTLTFSWQVVSSPDPKLDVTGCMAGKVCSLEADASGEYDVKLTVSDGTDTSSVVRTLRVLPGVPPVALLELISPTGPGPYPLGTTFRISSALSTGGDAMNPLTPNWTLNLDGTPGSTAVRKQCVDDPSPDVQCFTADAAGTYAVQLTVTNDTTSSPATLTLEVLPDQPPCIGMTMPPVTATIVSAVASMGMTFKVSTVEDDLDSIPPTTSDDPAAQALFGVPHFQWFVEHGTSGFSTTFVDANSFKIDPDEFQIGDQARVRLEISDDDADRSAKEFKACTDDTCFTGAEADGCFQRVTWTVNFNQ
jgi:PKD repeat protein